VKRLESQLHDYRARAQGLLAAKDAEIQRLVHVAPTGPDAASLAVIADLTEQLRAVRAEADAARDAADAAAAAAANARAAAEVEAAHLREVSEHALAQAEAHVAAAARERQRAEALEARLAHRDSAVASAPAAPEAGAAATHAIAERDALRERVTGLEAEAASQLEMVEKMAAQREDALSLALEQISELRRELEDARKTVVGPLAPATPSGRASAFEVQERASVFGDPPDGLSLARRGSFDMEKMLSTSEAESSVALRGRAAVDPDALVRCEAALAETRRENADLLREVALHEEQVGVLKEVVREAERNDRRHEVSQNAQTMQFLKANVLNMYRTGEAERLLGPISSLLQFSAEEMAACRDGLERLKQGETPLLGAAAAVDSAAGFFGGLFG